jgi:hypothetical protein
LTYLLAARDLQAIADRLTYPAATFRVRDDPFEGPVVRATITVSNAYGGAPLELGWNWYPSPNDRVNADAFKVALAWRIARHGNHEAREFLQEDGRPVNDPHADAE